MKIHILIISCLVFVTACSNNSPSDMDSVNLTPDTPPTVSSTELPTTK